MTTNPPLNWSDLVPDVLPLVYNRLSFADFARARTVCSSWYAVSRSSSPRKTYMPWLIFKQDMKWQLFNPEEGKFYKTHINRLGFADCRSLATRGNWVLVTDKKVYLYIFNPFTLEIIHLPPLERCLHKILDNCPIHFDYGFVPRHFVRVETAVLWVDERTKDYLVVWKSRDNDRLRFCMKGDEEWLETPGEYLEEDMDVDHMAYKDKKLYIIMTYGIKILDFSQDFPREVPNHPYVNQPFSFGSDYAMSKWRLTTSGDVMLIRRVPQLGKNIHLRSLQDE